MHELRGTCIYCIWQSHKGLPQMEEWGMFMRYVTYYEECNTLTADRYQQAKQMILAEEPKKKLEKYTLRKLQFIGNSSQKAIPNYYLCLRDKDENQIYLEKKYIQGGIYYKRCLKLSKEECSRILMGDLEWMKNHKKALLAEFYLQVTLNHLSPGYMTEYEREMVHCKKEGYVTFFKSIKRAVGTTNHLFEDPEFFISCLDHGKVLVTYKKAAKLPDVISSMIQVPEEPAEDYLFAY
jgi:hypothetical protein